MLLIFNPFSVVISFILILRPEAQKGKLKEKLLALVTTPTNLSKYLRVILILNFETHIKWIVSTRFLSLDKHF